MARNRIAYEKKVVARMIRLYCRRKEGNRAVCDSCRQLQEYAFARLDRCRFGERKPACRNCKVHCYKPEMREKIRAVMRWAGPRMLPVHPVLSVKHVAVTLKAKREAQKTDA